MPNTPNLGLPLLAAAQAQKHVTHNEALVGLDTLVQLGVISKGLTTPPPTPAEGDRYLVAAASPTGAWAGWSRRIARFQDGQWISFVPKSGWLAFVADEGALYTYNGSAWSVFNAGSAPTTLQNLSLLGIGATADATNPFSAKLNKALWAAKTAAEGGTGDLRYTLNKEAAANTLSLLLQSAFSGRAEIGLTGDDDLHLKVSADGSAWTEAVRIDRATGGIGFLAASTDVPSSATVDLGAVNGLKADITGTTTITSFGTKPNVLKLVRFAGALTLTHNAASLILPGAANILTAAGDTAIVTSDGSGGFRVRHYQRADGTPLVSPKPRGTFHVKRNGSTAQTGMPGGSFTKLQLDLKDLDTRGWYDTTNYRYTPQEAGWYLFYANCQLAFSAPSTDGAAVAIYKNGANEKQGGPMFVLSSAQCTLGAANVAALVSMNGTTDYVEFFGYVGSGSGITGSTSGGVNAPLRNFAGGYKVSA